MSKTANSKNVSPSCVSALIIHESYVNNKKLLQGKLLQINGQEWMDFSLLKMPKLNVTARISVPFHVTTKKCNHTIIFGRDLL